MEIEVRPTTRADAPAVRSVLTAAFRDDGTVAALAEALRARSDAQASLVAVDDNTVVGYTHLSVSWVDAPSALVDVLTLSPLAVAPSHHKRGIGTRLLHEARSAGEALGVPMLFLEGDPAYYSGRGWLAAGPLGFSAPSPRIPPAGFQVVLLDGYDPASMTGPLVYNDTFWAHDCVGLRP
jgi:putative acetyltransferase